MLLAREVARCDAPKIELISGDVSRACSGSRTSTCDRDRSRSKMFGHSAGVESVDGPPMFVSPLMLLEGLDPSVGLFVTIELFKGVAEVVESLASVDLKTLIHTNDSSLRLRLAVICTPYIGFLANSVITMRPSLFRYAHSQTEQVDRITCVVKILLLFHALAVSNTYCVKVHVQGVDCIKSRGVT